MRSDSSPPIVSFVVPVFNVAPYVRQCLMSILGQTVSDIEIIAVDDGSEDESGSICEDVASRDVRASVVHTQNCGVSHARNAGLDRALGQFICFVDSDDWLSPHFAERMIGLLTASGVDIAACGPTRVNPSGNVLWRQPRRHLVLDTEAALCGLLRRDFYCGWPWNKMFRLSLLRDNAVRFDEKLRYCEDLVFCFDAIRYASCVAYDSHDDLYFYRESESSVNRNTVLNGRFNPRYLNRLEADRMILDQARSVSSRVFRYAKANAFISNESIYRKIRTFGSPDRNLPRCIATNMGNNLSAVLRCGGFGGIRTKCRYVWETAQALCGKVPLQESRT